MNEVETKKSSGETPENGTSLGKSKISDYPKGIKHLDISDLKDLGFSESKDKEGLFYKNFKRKWENIEIEALIFADFRPDNSGVWGLNKDGKGDTESIPQESLRKTDPYQDLLERVDRNYRDADRGAERDLNDYDVIDTDLVDDLSDYDKLELKRKIRGETQTLSYDVLDIVDLSGPTIKIDSGDQFHIFMKGNLLSYSLICEGVDQ